MKNLTKKHKILIGLLVAAVIYLGFGFVELRKELFTVYDVPEKYTYRTSPDADLMVVDFNKYGCSHCRDLRPILREAMERDGNIIYIPRTVSFNDWGATITAAVYAAAEQDKFINMFDAVYDNWPVETQEELFAHARALGIDTEKLKQDMKNPDISSWAQYNDEYFKAWGLRATPTLLVGKKTIFRFHGQNPTVEDLLDRFARARQGWL